MVDDADDAALFGAPDEEPSPLTPHLPLREEEPAQDPPVAVYKPTRWGHTAVDLCEQVDGRLERLEPPHNIEAEQALLGALLYEPECFHLLPEGIGPDQFYEPFHGRLFHRIARGMRGQAEAPRLEVIAGDFERDGALHQLGGIRYLADLVDRAPPTANAPDYARALMDVALRRDMIRMALDLTRMALDGRDEDGEQVAALALAQRAEQQLTELQASDTTTRLVTASEASQQVFEHLEADESALRALTTGLAPLDLQLGPILPGDLVLVGGRPGMGKSTLSAAIAMANAGPQLALLQPGLEDDDLWMIRRTMREPVGIISISGEMAVKQSTWRMLAAIAYTMHGSAAPTYNTIRARTCTPVQVQMLRDAQREFDQLPLVQVKRTGMKLSKVRALARKQQVLWARQGIRLGGVILDHAGLVQPEGRVTSETEAQSQVARGAKELAGDLDCPLITLLQLSRQVEQRDDKRPTISDLRQSGQWEENADMVLLAYREAYYARFEKEPEQGKVKDFELAWADWDRRRKSKRLEMIMGKLRDGEGGTVDLWCDIGRNVVRGKEPDVDPARLNFNPGRNRPHA